MLSKINKGVKLHLLKRFNLCIANVRQKPGIVLQGDLVHQLKEKGASEQELSRAVAELKARKKVLEAKVRSLTTSLRCLPARTHTKRFHFLLGS